MYRLCLCIIAISLMLPHYSTQGNNNPLVSQIAQLGRGPAAGIDWHPDGEILAVGGVEHVWFYDENLIELGQMPMDQQIRYVKWSPNGQYLATSGENHGVNIRRIDLQTFDDTLLYSWQDMPVDRSISPRLSWNNDSTQLAITSSENGTHILDLSAREIIKAIPNATWGVSWHPDGQYVIGPDETNAAVKIWDVNTGEAVQRLTGVEDTYLFFVDAGWSPDGSTIAATTSLPASLHIWNVVGELQNIPDTSGDMYAFWQMQWSRDGETLYTFGGGVNPPPSAELWGWRYDEALYDWTETERWYLGRGTRNISLHPDEQRYATILDSGVIAVLEAHNLEPLATNTDFTTYITRLSWSPDGERLAVAAGGEGAALRIWNVFNAAIDSPLIIGELVAGFNWNNVLDMRWESQDTLTTIYEYAPSMYYFYQAEQWDTSTGVSQNIIAAFEGDWHPAWAWNSDFTRIAYRSYDGETLHLAFPEDNEMFGLQPGEEIWSVNIGAVADIYWSPDDTQIINTGEDLIQLRDAASGALIVELNTNINFVRDIVWRPDGEMFAVIGYIRAYDDVESSFFIEVFDLSGKSLQAIDSEMIPYAAWHPDGDWLVVDLSEEVAIYAVHDNTIDDRPTVSIATGGPLAWSPTGDWLASAENGIVYIWDVSELQD